ncbi:C6 finger domain transcription factor nscR [Trichinella spiralis]|uniref:C6 finger domain transcription factor nscR n=1 Tax=Trichinella spiralis TaxID=6334 RepID=A0ABR3KIV3_TRISP
MDERRDRPSTVSVCNLEQNASQLERTQSIQEFRSVYLPVGEEFAQPRGIDDEFKNKRIVIGCWVAFFLGPFKRCMSYPSHCAC